MDTEKINNLKTKAIELREVVISVVYKVEYGNIASSLGLADIMAALYFNFLKIDSKKPNKKDRDRIIVSRQKVVPLQYSALYLLGFMDRTNLYTLGQMNSIIQTSPDMSKCKGIDISSTGYGQGISQGIGMAISLKRDKKPSKVYVIVGDNECNQGQVWEAMTTAVKYKLDNLVILIDNSMPSDLIEYDIYENKNLYEKFKVFGFETRKINGNDMEEICSILEFLIKQKNGKPKCIVCDTTKGRDVSFMENVPSWNDTIPTKEQYEQAISELRELRGKD